MSDWTDGYVTDINYTFGYFPELSPLRARLTFLNRGLLPPPTSGTHCELGYGQGVSINIHAAASASVWYGNDFNSNHAYFAQSLAHTSGANAYLTDEAFIDFCNRTDLPDFDSIGLHGIWSWIDDDNRKVIVDFIQRKLKIGGVLYISYNTQPGWAALAPLRDLLVEHTDVMSAPGEGIVARIDAALGFVDKLFATNPMYLKANPLVAERFNAMKTQNRNYLAHEYFNRAWSPMPFSKVAEWLTPIKLGFACSAHYSDHFNATNLTPEQLQLLNNTPDAMFRETVRDFMVNQQFRKDYWVRGTRHLQLAEQNEMLRTLSVVLINHRTDILLKLSVGVGEIALQAEVYNPILDFLADHTPKMLSQIELAVKPSGIVFAQVAQAITILAFLGHLVETQNIELVNNAKIYTDKLNTHLINRAKDSDEIHYLASPVTGGGVQVTRFEQLFLTALNQGKADPTEWVQLVWDILNAEQRRIVINNKKLETPEENIAEITKQAHFFQAKKLHVLKALQVI